MFFGFPHDYQTDYYITKALGGYGSLVSWYNPQFGPELTAEQLYQQQVHNWLVQNGTPPAGVAN